MKKIKFISLLNVYLLISVININAQNNQISITTSNNGQTKGEIKEFYFGNLFSNNTQKFESSQIQLTVNYEHFFKNNYSLGLKAGYLTSNSFLTFYENVYSSANYNIFEFSVFVKHIWMFDKLQISTGIELPFYMISDFNSYFVNETITPIYRFNHLIEGGPVLGLNSISSLKYFYNNYGIVNLV